MEHEEAQRANTEPSPETIQHCASLLGVTPWKLEYMILTGWLL